MSLRLRVYDSTSTKSRSRVLSLEHAQSEVNLFFEPNAAELLEDTPNLVAAIIR